MSTSPRPRIEAFALCVACGATLPEWRETLLPFVEGRLVVTERRELALRMRRENACSVCGGSEVEVRVEDWTRDARSQ